MLELLPTESRREQRRIWPYAALRGYILKFVVPISNKLPYPTEPWYHPDGSSGIVLEVWNPEAEGQKLPVGKIDRIHKWSATMVTAE